MALTPAEKQKRYRERLKQNKEKYEEAKKRHREHYHKTKRLVKDFTPKEKKNANTIWKLRQREYRQRKKNLQQILTETPPSSPVLFENVPVAVNPVRPEVPPISAKERGRRKVKRDRSKLYRKNKLLEKQLQCLKKKCDKLRKRVNRSKANKSNNKSNQNEEGPFKKKYELLTSALRQKYKKVNSMKQKVLLKSILKSEEIKKVKNKNMLLDEAFGIKRDYKKKKNIQCADSMLRNKIHRFFLRDDISRATAGKKETVTKNGKKAQKRFLLDTMQNLHKHFQSENPEPNCSYFYFTKHRPFFVVKPSASSRETCLCKTHVNISYKAQALKRCGIIKTENLNDIIKEIVCDDKSKECMYNKCEVCKNKKLSYDENKVSDSVRYWQWIRKEETYEKDGKQKKTFKNIREEVSEETSHFLDNFDKDVIKFKEHIFNIKFQFHNFRECLNNLQSNECVLVVDFSENYNCKYNEEIQSHHFGGSRKQISLHTVMLYTHHPDKKYTPNSFCTISSSNCHQPAAIWAHLEPILQWISSELRSVNTVHFFSDGPSTQYRQKHNFYLFCKRIFYYGFEAATWSFFEAGHGKGPADGIGGFLKRTADKMVASGKDITCAEQFIEHLEKASKIKLYLISEEDIKKIQDQLPKCIPRLNGTLKVHHIFTDNTNYLKYRSLSCFCDSLKRGFCNCFNPQIHYIGNIEQVTNESLDVTPLTPARHETPSDEDMPRSSFTVLRDVQNQLPRTSVYQAIYGYSSDTDDEMPLTFFSNNKENDKTSASYQTEGQIPSSSEHCKEAVSKRIDAGDYLHVYVNSNNSKKQRYSYVCKALSSIEDDGEIKVMFLRVVGSKDAKRFRVDEHDISYIDYNDIVKKLPTPEVVKKGFRVYYQFEQAVDVFEK